MPNSEKLDEMSRMDIRSIDRNTLTDIQNVKIDTSLPIDKRMELYLEQVKNPYCFLCGEIPVRLRFAEQGKTLDEAIKDHFLNIKTL